MAVVSRLDPGRQLPVGDDDYAARFVQQHDRVIEAHEVFVRQLRVHHVVHDDERAAEPVLVPQLLIGDAVFVAHGVEELFDRAVADLDIRGQRLPAEMACQRRLAGAAFADDEQVLIAVDPREILQLLDLPADAAVDFLGEELLARQAAFMLELDAVYSLGSWTNIKRPLETSGRLLLSVRQTEDIVGCYFVKSRKLNQNVGWNISLS